jgi:hypothetical protein
VRGHRSILHVAALALAVVVPFELSDELADGASAPGVAVLVLTFIALLIVIARDILDLGS